MCMGLTYEFLSIGRYEKRNDPDWRVSTWIPDSSRLVNVKIASYFVDCVRSNVDNPVYRLIFVKTPHSQSKHVLPVYSALYRRRKGKTVPVAYYFSTFPSRMQSGNLWRTAEMAFHNLPWFENYYGSTPVFQDPRKNGALQVFWKLVDIKKLTFIWWQYEICILNLLG